MKRLNVIKVHESEKKITCKFGGAISGMYDVSIRHKDYGLIEASAFQLLVESHITAYSPQVGSIYGGTLVTITGTNWGDVTTDNPVEIFYCGGTVECKATKCYVESTSKEEIKCRIDTSRVRSITDKGKLMVYLQTYEEANCTLTNKCEFGFTDQVPTVTGVTKEWDTANDKWNLKVAGTAITGAKEDTHLYIFSSLQETQSVTGTEAIVRVTDSMSERMDALSIYWSVGLGLGNSALTATPITLEPKLVSVSPIEGSAGGTLITLNVQGVGIMT
jgi:hypothetical protein